MVDTNYILAPQLVKVRFDISPAFNGIESIREFNEVGQLSGIHEWVIQSAASLPPRRRDLNLIMFEGFAGVFFDMLLPTSGYADYLSYVDAIAASDPEQLRDGAVNLLVSIPHKHPGEWDVSFGEITREKVLNDEEFFVRIMTHFCCENAPCDEAIWHEAFALFNDPPQMQAAMIEHLRWMWDHLLAEEWVRVLPLLQELVTAFEAMDFSNMTIYEAIRAVTTRDLRGKLDEKQESADTIVFIPSAHIGPYIVKAMVGTTLCVIFGARLPRGWQTPSSALSRSELLTRLSALGDDTRLRILELLTKHEELCAQDIIEILGLSQSSISRHLSQLSANGFITERRREVSKCYSLNTDRVVDTLRTLTNFLSRQ